MSTTGLDTFDKTVQETNLWVKSLMQMLDTRDRHLAYMSLRGVLHALRDRIGPENAVHLGCQLPMLVRGMYFEAWHMAGTPTKERHKDQFLERVRAGFPKKAHAKLDVEKLTRAVFGVMWEKVEPGEVAKIIKVLPKQIRELWPAVAQEQ